MDAEGIVGGDFAMVSRFWLVSSAAKDSLDLVFDRLVADAVGTCPALETANAPGTDGCAGIDVVVATAAAGGVFKVPKLDVVSTDDDACGKVVSSTIGEIGTGWLGGILLEAILVSGSPKTWKKVAVGTALLPSSPGPSML